MNDHQRWLFRQWKIITGTFRTIFISVSAFHHLSQGD